jgi:hypothetical protein
MDLRLEVEEGWDSRLVWATTLREGGAGPARVLKLEPDTEVPPKEALVVLPPRLDGGPHFLNVDGFQYVR